MRDVVREKSLAVAGAVTANSPAVGNPMPEKSLAVPDPVTAKSPAVARSVRPEKDSLVLVVHVQPGAKRTEVAGVHGDALKIRVSAPAVEGKANAALRAFLAEAFGVPMRHVTLLRGEAARDKLVRIVAPALRPDRAWQQAGK